MARGRSEQVRHLVNTIPQGAKEIIVHYLGDPTNVLSLSDAVKNKFPDIPITQVKVGPVLGIHLGLGVIGISWISN